MSSYFKKFDPTVSQILLSMSKKSLSLSDISSLADLNGRLPEIGTGGETFNLSTETIGSHFGKDSGYVHSASVSSLNSSAADYCKTHGTVGNSSGGDDLLTSKVTTLLKELEDRKILIAELEKSNLNLRLQCAAAQSKISELRIKCEEHCGCCSASERIEKLKAKVDRASRPFQEGENVWKRPFKGLYGRPNRCSSLQSLNFNTSTPVKNVLQRNVDKVTEWRSTLQNPTYESLKPAEPRISRSSSNLAFPTAKHCWNKSYETVPSPIPHEVTAVSDDDDDDDDEVSSNDVENEDDVNSCNFSISSYSRTYKNRKEEMENIIRSSWNDIAQMGKMSNTSLSKLYRKEITQNFAKGSSPLLICLYEASLYANDLTNGLMSLSQGE